MFFPFLFFSGRKEEQRENATKITIFLQKSRKKLQYEMLRDIFTIIGLVIISVCVTVGLSGPSLQ